MSLTLTSPATTLLASHAPSSWRPVGRTPGMRFKRTLGLMSVLLVTGTLVACGGGSGSGANYGDCTVSSKANSIDITPVKSGTLTVETTLPAQGWWNGTTAGSIKS